MTVQLSVVIGLGVGMADAGKLRVSMAPPSGWLAAVMARPRPARDFKVRQGFAGIFKTLTV
jgi:hypothetical protein